MANTETTRHGEETALENALKRGRDWSAANLTGLIYGLAAALAVVAGWIWWNRTPAGDTAATSAFIEANSPEAYRDVADAYQDNRIGDWARLRQAEASLEAGINRLFTNRPTAVDELDAAAAAYSRLAERNDLPGELRERVLVGLARLAEARCDGSEASVTAAKNAWQQVQQQFEDGMYAELTDNRLAALNEASTAEFYRWFAEQNPTPAAMATPGSSVPAVPSDSAGPGALPGLDLESLLQTPPATEEPTSPADPQPENGADSPASGENPEADPAAAEAAPTESPAPQENAAEPATESPEAAADTPSAETPGTEPAAETPPPVSDEPAEQP